MKLTPRHRLFFHNEAWWPNLSVNITTLAINTSMGDQPLYYFINNLFAILQMKSYINSNIIQVDSGQR